MSLHKKKATNNRDEMKQPVIQKTITLEEPNAALVNICYQYYYNIRMGCDKKAQN